MKLASTATTILLASLVYGAAPAAAQDQPAEQPPSIQITQPDESRPRILPPLYVGLAALQAYDGYTTIHGVRGGASETNVLVGGLASRPAAFWSVKAASTVVSIYFAEQLWRSHHRTEAVVMMVVANGVMTAVAARNASVSSRP
jgi:hypothetical protein